MENLQGFYFVTAIAFTVVFIGQFLMSLILDGGDHDGDLDFEGETDVDMDGDDLDLDANEFLKLFALKNIISFGLGFGWGGWAMMKSGMPNWSTYIVSVIIGIIFASAIWKFMQLMKKMAQDNTPTEKSFIGNHVKVYLSIGKNRTDAGSVVTHGREFRAWTESDKDLKAGEIVEITQYDDGEVLCKPLT